MKKKYILVVVIVLGLILIFLSILGVKKYNIIKEIIQKSDEYCNKENVYHKISATDSSLAYVELFKNKEKEKIVVEKNEDKTKLIQYITTDGYKTYFEDTNGEITEMSQNQKIFPIDTITIYLVFKDRANMFFNSIFANIKSEKDGDKEYFVITDINCQATEYDTKAKYYINKENGLVEKIEMKHEDNSVSIVTHEYKFDVVTDKDF